MDQLKDVRDGGIRVFAGAFHWRSGHASTISYRVSTGSAAGSHRMEQVGERAENGVGENHCNASSSARYQ